MFLSVLLNHPSIESLSVTNTFVFKNRSRRLPSCACQQLIDVGINWLIVSAPLVGLPTF
jgi:hypothetical protein